MILCHAIRAIQDGSYCLYCSGRKEPTALRLQASAISIPPTGFQSLTTPINSAFGYMLLASGQAGCDKTSESMTGGTTP
jgi:hypothetical protein